MRKITQKVRPPPHTVEQPTVPADDHRSAYPFDKKQLLSSHPFFSNFSAAIIERLLSRAVIRQVKKGTVLFRKGDVGSSLYAVCLGTIRISVPSPQGKEAILNVFSAHEVFGEIALLDGGVRTADAVATEDSELLVIDRRDFIPLVHENPDVALKLIELVCARLRRTSDQVEDAVFLDLPQRLAKVLLEMHSQVSTDQDQTISVTQRDLSQMVGASRESTNKTLREWEGKGWLKLHHRGLTILHPNALAAIVSKPV
jgi:CRP/FNR family cyclic AMP-dependent transcriptional regulator